MPNRSEAEEHLRVIRSLMERATIYRSISAPGAAIGGCLALAASFGFGNWWAMPLAGAQEHLIGTAQFLGLWSAVLAVTATANLLFLWRDSRRRGDKFVSSGMKLAALALSPSYLVAVFGTWVFAHSWVPSLMVPVWIVCHGLALLATAHFAPRSLAILGWAFLVAGLLSIGPIADTTIFVPTDTGTGRSGVVPLEMIRSGGLFYAQRWMAGSFGLLHLIYAACVWPRRGKGDAGAATA